MPLWKNDNLYAILSYMGDLLRDWKVHKSGNSLKSFLFIQYSIAVIAELLKVWHRSSVCREIADIYFPYSSANTEASMWREAEKEGEGKTIGQVCVSCVWAYAKQRWGFCGTTNSISRELHQHKNVLCCSLSEVILCRHKHTHTVDSTSVWVKWKTNRLGSPQLETLQSHFLLLYLVQAKTNTVLYTCMRCFCSSHF